MSPDGTRIGCWRGIEHRLTRLGGQRPVLRPFELPIARIPDALCRLDRKEAIAFDGKIERIARRRQRSLP
jgi:hypothetical protein